MNYDAPARKKLDRPVEVSDICEFFTDFMKNNRLGQIANLHMALADFNADGVRNNECIRLAELVGLHNSVPLPYSCCDKNY